MGKNTANKAGAGLSKRWFANMTGWGVSFQVGSGEPQKSRRSLPVSSDQRFLATSLTQAMTHNTIYTFNPLSVITQGTAGYQREGNGIQLKGISFRFTLESWPDKSSVVRLMVVASTKQFSSAGLGAGLGSGDLFFSGTVNSVVGHVDSRLAKVVCDVTYELKPRTATQLDVLSDCFDCEINVPFAYQSASSYGESANLYLIATACTPNGVTGTTNCVTLIGETLVSWAG